MSSVVGGAPKYLLHDLLGKGGMGAVYLGTLVGPAGERKVAIKKLLAAEDAPQLISEGRLVFRLTHTNICQVLDLAAGDDGVFMVMEYVEGLDLHSLLKARGSSLDVASAVYVAREVVRGLGYAHRRVDDAGRPLQLVHGDVTPRNILISCEGEVKLADFGIARALHTIAPGNWVVGGTPGFMAPEVASGGDADPRADLYSLGVTLYVALGGTVAKGERGDLRGLTIDPDLGRILERVMSTHPNDRFASASALEQELSFLLARRHPAFTPEVLGNLVRTHRSREPVAGPEATMTLASVMSASELTIRVKDPVAAAEPEAPAIGTRPVGPPKARGRGVLATGIALAAVAGIAFAIYARAPKAAASFTPPPSSTPPPPPIHAESVAPLLPAPEPIPAAPSIVTAAAAPAPKPRPAPAHREKVQPVRAASAPPGPASDSRAMGYLSVEARPWGQLFVDGKKVADQTPVYRLPVASGAHRVTVFNPAKRQHSPPQNIVITPGQNGVLGFRW
jgi:serine/threonine-protein kinase